MEKQNAYRFHTAAVALVVALLAFLPAWASTGEDEPRQPSMSALSEAYDIVIRNGRVMDPESGLDAIRSVGVTNGVISAISSEPLPGRVVIDATGLLVAPGFIDYQLHMQPHHHRVQILDGVTTALETVMGIEDVDRWYTERERHALINFGVSVGHGRVRMSVMRDPGRLFPGGDARNRAATPGEIAEIRQKIERELRRGALGVSFSYMLTPAASGWETLETFRAAASLGAPVNATLRGGWWSVDDMPRYLADMIGMATVTRVPLHINHLKASGGPHTPRMLQILQEARSAGLEITAEIFPYTTSIARLTKGEGETDDWQSWPDNAFHDFESMETGERLTRESYARYLERDALVLVHNDALASIMDEIVASPLTMVISYAHLDEEGNSHPRMSGTRARLLGHYVREKRVLSLMEAIRKMTLMPARRFEQWVPAMKNKGRIREGADADIVVFDAERIIDQATFREPTNPSQGVAYVLINGVLVARDGVIQEGVYAGQPVRASASSGQRGN